MKLLHKPWLRDGIWGAAALGLAISSPALAQEGEIEEVVVTGSYIMRSAQD